MDNMKSQDTLKSLLRGEISAVETYRQAKEKYKTEPGFNEIHRIEEEHEEAMRELRGLVPSFDESTRDSGVWGSYAKTVVGGAKLMGYKATLKALKEGEEHGVKEYESALQSVDGSAKMVLSKYLARQREHIAVIDRQLT